MEQILRLPPYVDFRSPEDAQRYETELAEALERQRRNPPIEPPSRLYPALLRRQAG